MTRKHELITMGRVGVDIYPEQIGVGPGEKVAVWVPNWVEGALTYQAALSLGAVVVPIIHIYGPREVGFILRQSGARVLVMPDRWRTIDYLERFAAKLSATGEGGHVTFSKSGKEIDIDGAKTLMEAGEEAGVEMPYGCRMGICHTCTLTKIEGKAIDLRNGEVFDQPNEQVQTCVTVPVGPCVLNI